MGRRYRLGRGSAFCHSPLQTIHVAPARLFQRLHQRSHPYAAGLKYLVIYLRWKIAHSPLWHAFWRLTTEYLCAVHTKTITMDNRNPPRVPLNGCLSSLMWPSTSMVLRSTSIQSLPTSVIPPVLCFPVSSFRHASKADIQWLPSNKDGCVPCSRFAFLLFLSLPTCTYIPLTASVGLFLY